METHQDRRLRERSGDLLRQSMRGRLVLLASAAAIVLVHTFLDALVGYYLLVGRLGEASVWSTVTLGLTAIINMILLFLMWMAFETLGRVERESDRMQAFMDNVYRRVR